MCRGRLVCVWCVNTVVSWVRVGRLVKHGVINHVTRRRCYRKTPQFVGGCFLFKKCDMSELTAGFSLTLVSLTHSLHTSLHLPANKTSSSGFLKLNQRLFFPVFQTISFWIITVNIFSFVVSLCERLTYCASDIDFRLKWVRLFDEQWSEKTCAPDSLQSGWNKSFYVEKKTKETWLLNDISFVV